MSSRNSRIPHPPGGRFFAQHAWAVRAVGFAAASVLGAIDFLDRAQNRPGQIVATRARLVADLDGIVGRNAVDSALATLVGLGWLRRHERVAVGERNFQTTHEFSLVAEAVAAFLQRQPGESRDPEIGTPEIPNSGRRESRFRSLNRDASIREKEKEEKPPPPGGGAPHRATTAADDWAFCVDIELEIEAARRPIRNAAALRKQILARYGAQGGPDRETVAELRRRRVAAERQAAATAAPTIDVTPPTSPDVAKRHLAAAKAALTGRRAATIPNEKETSS